MLCPPVTVTTGVAPRRPQVRPLGGLKPWPDSSSKTSQGALRRDGPFYDGPRLLPPEGDGRLVPLGGAPGRDLHAPPDPVQQHVHPRQRVLHPEPAGHQLGDPGQVQHWSSSQPQTAGPASRAASSSRSWPGVSLHLAPPAPLVASAFRPPSASVRRHRFADIRDTRNRLATSRSLAPASISSAASSRTRSRRDRSAAVSPPPPGYLMTPAYRDPPATARGRNLRH
jgi:hypothetical protein